MNKIKVNPSEITGIIKPMNGVCYGPRTGGAFLYRDATKEYREMNIPYVRLHDVEYPYGSDQYCDIHCIFPDFSADVNDEKAYNFKPTDNYLKAILDSGAQVFYRLGESIEHYEMKIHCRPPEDYIKWAEICEHIIMHYNYGWNNGFYWNIKHWEIWNEPESRGMWTGTREQFYELYTVVSKYLKKKFPEIMVGGYSAVGFYTETRDKTKPNFNPWFNTILPFMNGFFEYIKGKDVPIDFFSWHCYAENPEEIGNAAVFIRNYLDEKGYKNAESYLTEYNNFLSLGICPASRKEYMAELLAGMIVADENPMDMMIYYYMSMTSDMNGVIYYNLIDGKIKKYPGYNSMVVYGRLLKMRNRISVEYEKGQGIYVMGARDKNSVLIAMSVMNERDYLLEIKGAEGKIAQITVITPDGKKHAEKQLVSKDGTLEIKNKNNCIYCISYEI